MRFQRFGMYTGKWTGDWQLNIGLFQFNWTNYSKDYPKLPWGMRIWFNHKHLVTFYTRCKY